jgi:16S rRNA G1207 methylase RsmC
MEIFSLVTEIIHNCRVLELGSGAGFLGLVVAELQLDANPKNCSLTMTDVHSEVLSRCRNNFQLSCSKFIPP